MATMLHEDWETGIASKGPAHVTFEPTIRCNLRCPMCYRTHKPEYAEHLRGEMPTETILKMIAEFGEIGVKQVLVIGGGDPLMRRDIHEILAALKQANIFTHLWTNGTLVDERNVTYLVDNADIITISLDSTRSEVNDVSRGVAGAFQRSSRALRLIGSRGSKCYLRIHAVVSKLNYDHLCEFVDFARAHGIKEIGGGMLHAYDFVPEYMIYDNNELPMVDVEIKKLRAYAESAGITLAGSFEPIFKNSLDRFAQSVGLEVDMRLTSTTCFGLWSMATVKPNGDVSICCWTSEPDLGNISTFDGSFMRLWNSEKVRGMRQRVKQGELLDPRACKGCLLGHPAWTQLMADRSPVAGDVLDDIVVRSR